MKKYFNINNRKAEFGFRPLNKLYEKYAGRKKNMQEKPTALAQSLAWGAGAGVAAGLIRFLIRKGADRYAAY
jgi:hypothetical protein